MLLKKKNLFLHSFFKNQLIFLNLHWGHSIKQWNIGLNNYLLGIRNLTIIFDINKLMFLLRNTLFFLKNFFTLNQKFVFLTTKLEFSNYFNNIIYESPYSLWIRDFWVNGYLTNFKYIEHEKFLFYKRHNKAWKARLKGTYYYKILPRGVLSFDNNTQTKALKEAERIRIPSIGVLDSDAPNLNVMYPLLGNDDSFESVNFYFTIIYKTFNQSKCIKKKKFLASYLNMHMQNLEKVSNLRSKINLNSYYNNTTLKSFFLKRKKNDYKFNKTLSKNKKLLKLSESLFLKNHFLRFKVH